MHVFASHEKTLWLSSLEEAVGDIFRQEGLAEGQRER